MSKKPKFVLEAKRIENNDKLGIKKIILETVHNSNKQPSSCSRKKEMDEKLFKTMGCTGSQPVRQYGLPNMLEKSKLLELLRPLQIRIGIATKTLNRWSSSFFA